MLDFTQKNLFGPYMKRTNYIKTHQMIPGTSTASFKRWNFIYGFIISQDFTSATHAKGLKPAKV